MKYQIILFDADDTLFDFQKTAELCFLGTSEEFGLPSEFENYEIYRDINQKYWDLYSEGKIGKEEIIPSRFKEYSLVVGVSFDIPSFAKTYSKKLSETSVLFPETKHVVVSLKKLGARLFIITNGISEVQRGRLKLSGIAEYFENLFISDELGAAKPSGEFFRKVAEQIHGFKKEKALIVGDSPLSDISMGYENGIDTCFVKKTPKEGKTVPYTYEITDLNDLIEIVK